MDNSFSIIKSLYNIQYNSKLYTNVKMKQSKDDQQQRIKKEWTNVVGPA